MNGEVCKTRRTLTLASIVRRWEEQDVPYWSWQIWTNINERLLPPELIATQNEMEATDICDDGLVEEV